MQRKPILLRRLTVQDHEAILRKPTIGRGKDAIVRTASNPRQAVRSEQLTPESKHQLREWRHLSKLSPSHPGKTFILELIDSAKYVDEQGNAILHSWTPRMTGDVITADEKGYLHASQYPDIGVGLLKALTFMHDHGTYHGDVKPDNLLLHYGFGPRGMVLHSVKLGDFGFIRREGDADERISGTLQYLAPKRLLKVLIQVVSRKAGSKKNNQQLKVLNQWAKSLYNNELDYDASCDVVSACFTLLSLYSSKLPPHVLFSKAKGYHLNNEERLYGTLTASYLGSIINEETGVFERAAYNLMAKVVDMTLLGQDRSADSLLGKIQAIIPKANPSK